MRLVQVHVFVRICDANRAAATRPWKLGYFAATVCVTKGDEPMSKEPAGGKDQVVSVDVLITNRIYIYINRQPPKNLQLIRLTRQVDSAGRSSQEIYERLRAAPI
jgi:hypothetical protein